jgi:hypothetical protein
MPKKIMHTIYFEYYIIHGNELKYVDICPGVKYSNEISVYFE